MATGRISVRAAPLKDARLYYSYQIEFPAFTGIMWLHTSSRPQLFACALSL